MTTGTASPQIDGRIDWSGTTSALATQYPAASTRLGAWAWTTDNGIVANTGAAWVPGGALNPTFVNASLSGFFYESATDGITAHAGGGQANATLLTTELNRVTTVATANDSVALPASAPGLTIIVNNKTAKPLAVFGSGTDTIDDVATATGIIQMPYSVVLYVCTVAGSWYTEGLATGYVDGNTSLQTFSSTDGITAHAGGGQGSAVLLVTMMSRVATVATGGDSVKLPPSAQGMDITVTNAAANSLNVFPNTGDNINALGANTAFALGATKSVQFICYTAGQWHTLPLVP